MARKNANTSFSKFKQAELVTIATNIISTMEGNADIFANPTPSLASVKVLLTAYSTVMGKPEYAGKTGDVKNARIALEEGLKSLGIYVNGIANGDLAILEKSGFPISKDHTKYGPLPMLKYAHFKNGESGGSIEFDLEPLDGCFGYMISSTLASDPETDPRKWQTDWHSKSTGVLYGFERGKEYKFAVAAVGASEIIHWYMVGRTLFAN